MSASTRQWKPGLRAAAIHLALSMLLAALAAGLVFGLWFPYPYREISGGSELFSLLVGVDVVIGPLITLVVFDLRKPRPELRRDLAVVGVLQLAALGYGLWTMSLARPVHLVFEYSRFNIVHAVDVSPEMLRGAPPELRTLPLGGPTLLSLRPFKDDGEKMAVTMAALDGLAVSARPELWQPYAAGKDEVLKAARPVAALRQRFPQRGGDIDALAAGAGRPADTLVYVPMRARKSFWTVFLDPATAQVVGFLPLDSF